MAYSENYKGKTFVDGVDVLPAGAINEALQNGYMLSNLFKNSQSGVIELGNFKIAYGSTSISGYNGTKTISYGTTFNSNPVVVVTAQTYTKDHYGTVCNVSDLTTNNFKCYWQCTSTMNAPDFAFWIAIGM